MADEVARKMSESSERVLTWADEDRYWRDNFRSRANVSADRDYEYYRPAYRYGFESASQYRGHQWNDIEPDLRSGWDRYEHRGAGATWESIKYAVKDAWDRVTR